MSRSLRGPWATSEPSQPSSRRRLRRQVVLAGVTLAAIVAWVGMLVAHEPGFYRDRLAVADAAARGRRLVTKLAALDADVARVGRWDAVFAESEVNGWLATDLPRNFGGMLPSWMTAPRVAILPGRLRLAARLGHGLAGTVASVEATIVLREANQIGIAVTRARLGGLPLPPGPFIHEIARRLAACGAGIDLRRVDGHPLLVVYISPRQATVHVRHRIASMSLEDAAVLVAGETLAAADGER